MHDIYTIKQMNMYWADQYGPRWYLHKDGRPPHGDDNDYVWLRGQWVKVEDAPNE